ncbi:hypothetical protein EIP91_003583 [Steccherinum ochraceum]|uniref:Fe2OG dioxygenase domain-containing protein n=1 Tax=Steccherinum ochraceum TaxID=92696 RepID=A0A4R0RGM9_9APHY|nr:hypothetical protein EIP91_003583 [Steccherinum ochraceum]
MTANFSSIPVLDYSLLSSPETRSEFIRQLQHTLINVGFLYLSNPPVAREDIDAVINYCPRLFDIPTEAKEKIQKANSPHFLGYSSFGTELTKGQIDLREQYDFGTPYEADWHSGDPEYHRLLGPSQWPDEDLIPGFKDTFLKYFRQLEKLSTEFIALIEEALELPPGAMKQFFSNIGGLQHWGKVVKYPAPDNSSNQGVGAHYDPGFLTFLLQASAHRGLQVQNLVGDWIHAPPIPGTFVVNMGKALETVTQGLAKATSHRVLSPEKGSSPRYSVPFFQNISQDIVVGESILHFKPEILKLKETGGKRAHADPANYSEYDRLPSGQVCLIARVKSHPDVAQRHYPELFQQFFSQTPPAQALVLDACTCLNIRSQILLYPTQQLDMQFTTAVVALTALTSTAAFAAPLPMTAENVHHARDESSPLALRDEFSPLVLRDAAEVLNARGPLDLLGDDSEPMGGIMEDPPEVPRPLNAPASQDHGYYIPTVNPKDVMAPPAPPRIKD